MPTDKMIRAKVKCCSCEGSLQNSGQVNIVCLMKEAEWKFPAWGNILLGVFGFASAVLCDNCVKEGKKPKFAVEWAEDLSIVKYHLVEQLRDVPKEIFKPLDMLELGRHRVGG